MRHRPTQRSFEILVHPVLPTRQDYGKTVTASSYSNGRAYRASTRCLALNPGKLMKRRGFIKLVGGAVMAWPFAAHAQQATKMPRVGLLSLGGGDKSDASLATLNAFVPALKEHGYTEGQNIAFDRKFADGDANKLVRLAKELVDSQVDAIVTLATPAARAVKQATSSIPIIAIGMADPVEDELVSSLARPGGNVTGTAFLGPELVSRRLQLLKELVPRLSRVAVLWHPRAYGERTMAGMLKEIDSAAQSLGTKIQLASAADPVRAWRRFRGDHQRAIRWPYPVSQPDVVQPILTHRDFCGQQPLAGDVCSARGCRTRRSRFIWCKFARSVPGDRRLSGQNPQRRKAGRIARTAADQIRIGDQSEGCQSARFDDQPGLSADRRRSNRLAARSRLVAPSNRYWEAKQKRGPQSGLFRS